MGSEMCIRDRDDTAHSDRRRGPRTAGRSSAQAHEYRPEVGAARGFDSPEVHSRPHRGHRRKGPDMSMWSLAQDTLNDESDNRPPCREVDDEQVCDEPAVGYVDWPENPGKPLVVCKDHAADLLDRHVGATLTSW